MTAVETLLTGLIDYAGLYPPAGLDMRTAVRNYLSYQDGPHAFALGRFIVDIARADELHEAAGDALGAMPLSAITQSPSFRVRASESLDQDGLTIYERV